VHFSTVAAVIEAVNELQLRVPAAERRQNVATGTARGFSRSEVPAPEGRKIPRVHANLSPLIGNRSGDDEAREE